MDLAPFLKDIRVISFDAGFTLIYPEPPVGTVYAQIAAAFGYRLDAAEVHARFKKTWLTKSTLELPKKIAALANEEQAYGWWFDIFKDSVGETVAPCDLEKMFAVCFNEYAKGRYWKVYPGVAATLAALRDGGFRLVVLSNWDHRLLHTLKDLHLAVFFEKIYISTAIGFAKPDPRAFRHVCTDLKVPPEAVLHVGDSPEEDIRGARQAGIRAVHLLSHGHGVRIKHLL